MNNLKQNLYGILKTLSDRPLRCVQCSFVLTVTVIVKKKVVEELTTATLEGTEALQQCNKPVERAEIWATGQGFDG